MATLTLHDGETDPLAGEGDPEPVVAAADHSKVTFALDPDGGRATVRFAIDPGARPVVADLAVEDGDELPDLYRAVQRRVSGSDLVMAMPVDAPAHLNVFHYLARPEPAVPDVEIRAHVVSTDEGIEVGVPTAAEATSVVAFFRERAPWKSVAVQAVGAGVSTDDADVVVTVDPRYDELTWVSRDESWEDEDAVPDDIAIEFEEPAGAASVPDFSPDATGVGDQPEGEPSVLRVYDGETGELQYDAKDTAETPEATSGTASRRYAEGQALVVDPDEGAVRARLAATGAGADWGFLVVYNHYGDGELVAGFVEELALRVDDLGVAFAVDLGDETVAYDRLTAPPSRPDGLDEAALAHLDGSGEPVDFAAPDGRTALELARYLRANLGDDRSVAVSATGRTADLADVDVVVSVDAGVDGIAPRGATATRLADGRLRDRLAEAREALEAAVGRIEAVTGTTAARQRVLAAALSGDALASHGLTVAPVDDSPLARRRRQARYLVLYGLVVAWVALGVDAGRFDPLVALLGATYEVDLGLLAGTAVSGLAGTHAVAGRAVVGGSAAALVAGAYVLFGYPLGPLAAARALAKTVRKQVTGGAGSGTVPNSVAELAAPLEDAIDDLHAGYEQLADVEGTVAAGHGSFPGFLEECLLVGRRIPDVRVVDRDERRGRLLVVISLGAVVGTALAILVLGGLWYVAGVAARTPTLVFDGLVVAVGLTALASLVKAVVVRYAGGWPRSAAR